MSNITEKYIATLVVHALGDTIGYKNGEWEFNFNTRSYVPEITLEIVYDFINLGGINQINLKNWNVSDDTIMHLWIAESLIKEDKPELISNYAAKRFVESFNDLKGRHPGITTTKSIMNISKGKNWNKQEYDIKSGGSGASMRSSCIGLAFYGEDKRDLLIETAIETSRITHISAIGYLGGLTSALFTAFAIENVKIKDWPFKLLKLLESSMVRKYIKKNDQEYEDYETYTDYWRKYIALKFKDGEVIHNRSDANLLFRFMFHYDNFSKDNNSFNIGESGYGSVIMAYDSLLDAGEVWEKLVYYAMLHAGDSDTVGAIAGSWYGALYGFKHIPKSNLEYLEFKDKLEKCGHKLYKKYYSKEK